jgi:hypothetical protein
MHIDFVGVEDRLGGAGSLLQSPERCESTLARVALPRFNRRST